ncbi:DNA-directed RNA polymerase V subunit 7-like [Argentina anserina]|uniref:DNA-directed RNA polymerase V subunit 7-like n=1 Tax=Argentina anserina TaxID=57926 RepID=UPI0021762BA6|nr:DNA-directed RNA polymerase V subunit 7-like [Potentilla anserina]
MVTEVVMASGFSADGLGSMYLKVKLCWNVVIPPKSLQIDGVKFQTELSRRLLNAFSEERATKDLGYLLAVTTVESIGDGKVRPGTGEVKYPVVFNCITFKLFPGEIIHAVVCKVMWHGVCLRCGPVENLFLSANRIPDYQYIPRDDDSMFLNPAKSQSRIRKDVTIRCIVIATRWSDADREFRVLVDLPDI